MSKAEKRLKYAEKREITEENSDLILEDGYEAIREAIDSILTVKGYKSYSHEATIIYAFEELDINYGKANKLNKFRELRNDSKYRGEDITKKEARETLEMAKKLIPKLTEKLEETL